MKPILLPTGPFILPVFFRRFFPFLIVGSAQVDSFIRINDQISCHPCFTTAHRALGGFFTALNTAVYSFVHPSHDSFTYGARQDIKLI